MAAVHDIGHQAGHEVGAEPDGLGHWPSVHREGSYRSLLQIISWQDGFHPKIGANNFCIEFKQN